MISTTLRLCLLLPLLALGAAGCGSWTRSSPPTVWLGLEPALPGGGLRAGAPGVEVQPFSTAPPFATTRVITREGEGRWELAHYHRWVSQPGDLVAHETRAYLSRADLFGAVLSAPGAFDTPHRLGGTVRALYWDRVGERAVLEVEISLATAPDRFAGFWVYRAHEPLPGEGVQGFLEAASVATARVLAELTRDLERALATGADR